MNTPELSWDVFHGASSPAVTRVYLRVRRDTRHDSVQKATITGPYCEYARTLPTTVRFRPVADQPGLYEAVFPDLTAWTPELPHWYRIRVEWDGGAPPDEQLWSVRRMSTAGGQLFWDGRRRVLQAIGCPAPDPQNLMAWRERDVAMVVAIPDQELCRAASRLGIPLLVMIPSSAASRELLAEQVRAVARWPAVAMLIWEGNGNNDIGSELFSAAPNTLLAADIDSSGDIAERSHVLVCHERRWPTIRERHDLGQRPVLITRELATDDLEAAQQEASAMLGRLGRIENLAGVALLGPCDV